MAKSSVAVRKSRSTSSRSAGSRSTRTTTKPTATKRKTSAAARKTTATAAAPTLPTPHQTALTDAELEIIWKTYKRTRDESGRPVGSFSGRSIIGITGLP